MQKAVDIQCQHKITEMVALMEKHKVNSYLYALLEFWEYWVGTTTE